MNWTFLFKWDFLWAPVQVTKHVIRQCSVISKSIHYNILLSMLIPWTKGSLSGSWKIGKNEYWVGWHRCLAQPTRTHKLSSSQNSANNWVVPFFLPFFAWVCVGARKWIQLTIEALYTQRCFCQVWSGNWTDSASLHLWGKADFQVTEGCRCLTQVELLSCKCRTRISCCLPRCLQGPKAEW